MLCNYGLVVLGGVIVSLLVTGHKVHEFKPAEGDGVSNAIKIRRTPSFGVEVKPSAPCFKILLHIKHPFISMEKIYFVRPNSLFLSPVPHALLLG
jgi:hypothetical protein